jgi:lysine-specific demethylase/histidyl-hydroxylase NO66
VREGHTIAPEIYTRRARLQSRTVDDFVDAGRVFAAFADGATVVLQALHRHWVPLSHFCRDLELMLTHPVQVNVYLTPPSSRGLDVHYDTHDVFVLQISGVKHWKVWGRAVDRPLSHQRRKTKYDDPGDAEIDVELKPGDALYIPRGFLHAAETTARESSHMTVGILTYTWMDVVKAAVERASDEVFVREALPAGFAHHPKEAAGETRRKLEEFTTWLKHLEADELLEQVSDRFWSSRTPVLTRQLRAVLEADDVDDATTLRRRRGAVARLHVEGDDLILALGDRRLIMPVRLDPVLRFALDRSKLQVAELARWLDEGGRRTLARRLILEGLLEQDPGG